MASTSRPTRIKYEPSKNRHNAQLNLDLIQKLQASKGTKFNGNSLSSCASILAKFIKSANSRYKQSLFNKSSIANVESHKSNKVEQKRQVPKLSLDKDKNRNLGFLGEKKFSKAVLQAQPQAQMLIEKSKMIQKTKNFKQHKSSSTHNLFRKQQQVIDQMKQKKKERPIIEPSQSQPQCKPFKRSSYHVAIAYSIYVNHLKLQNPDIVINSSNCDPTLVAKKVKGASNTE